MSHTCFAVGAGASLGRTGFGASAADPVASGHIQDSVTGRSTADVILCLKVCPFSAATESMNGSLSCLNLLFKLSNAFAQTVCSSHTALKKKQK